LKPANIMIDGHGRVRITDFGIAIAIDDETQAAEISGTPAYMAPEQLAGKGATVRSDIYSLGLILYEVCSGQRAFTAATVADFRHRRRSHAPAVSDIRSSVDPILERLMAREHRPRPALPARPCRSRASLPATSPFGDRCGRDAVASCGSGR
jgi:serine/threonine protein kinase